MFEEILTIINVIKTLVSYSFYYSFKTGQCLVYAINFILNNIVRILEYVREILVIVLESFTIFCQDILQGLQLTLEVTGQIWEAISTGFSTTVWSINNILCKISYVFSQSYILVENSILNVGILSITICKLIKQLIILFGAGVWFAITLLPISVLSVLNLFTYLIKTLIKTISSEIVRSATNLKDSAKNVYIFVTDVPGESVIGLIIAICLIYILTQFYVMLYHNFRQMLFNILSKFRRQHLVQPINIRRNDRITNNLSRSTSNRRPQIRRVSEPSPETKASVPDERFCVICQERIKCILVLPCRHVCMCMECNTRLQLYNNTCPICRNDIESTMKIFV